MIRKALLALGATGLALTVGATVAPAAMAATPRFVSVSDSIDSSGDLVVSWHEAGLGRNQPGYLLESMQAAATWTCADSSGTSTVGPVDEFTRSFSSSKSGDRATLQAPLSSLTCADGSAPQLTAVSYVGNTLTDTTYGDSVTLANVSQ